MFEKILTSIIHEFGPAGVLILGIFLIFYNALKKICIHIETMNHNSTKIVESIDRCADRICDKING